MAINFYIIARMLIGIMFIVSGFEKLISPYQNFLYVIEGYDLFPSFLEMMAAHAMPWVEFFLGIFLFLGLWLKWVLRAVLAVMLMFIVIVAQAIIRNLPIGECGCFGDFISLPLSVILLFDAAVFLVTGLLIEKEEKASLLSLDRYFSK